MDLKEQYDRLLRYCYMKTKDPYLAEDIVQETFLKFWQSRSYKDTGKEMAYLYTIARNLCIDGFRKPKTENIDDYASSAVYVMSEQEKAVTQLALEEALNKLPDDLREIVTLRYVSGISAADIGRIVGMSRFSVYRRLKESLRTLKKYLE
ncbi:MAG: RNA polymerase sigma factor [Firmicutes bacterium]|nr:RNA polymerase sigma factor [Bacillota bacterium]